MFHFLVSLRSCVLILVLMEDTLRGEDFLAYLESKKVLILVLMEDTLRAIFQLQVTSAKTRLNPCFNGRYSQSFGSLFLFFILSLS